MYSSRTRLLSAFVVLTGFGSLSIAQTNGAPDLTKQPTLYAVGYAHLDTEWRWEYPQVIDEYLYRTMHDNFALFPKYPHYIFNFSGANRYRLMREYFPADFTQVKQYVAQGRWFPAGSSMEEGDVNAPNAEAIIRQILYGNEWFRKNLGKASEEYMLPDCFGFPSSLPSILAHSGVKGFSTQKLTWGSSADTGGPESLEETPEGTPFNVGIWVGPDGSSVLAAMNPGSYSGSITTDLSAPLPPLPANPLLPDIDKKLTSLEGQMQASGQGHVDQATARQYFALRQEQSALESQHQRDEQGRFQGDWAARVLNNGKVTGLMADYHYYGTGDIGGAPREESVKLLEEIVTKGTAQTAPSDGMYFRGGSHTDWPSVPVGNGPVHVISATADQMFKDITPAEAASLPRYTGELELTNHSAGSLTSQAYQKRWIRKEELLADAAEKSSLAALWLGGRSYPLQRLNDAWTLAMAAHFHDLAAGTATPRSYEFAWNDDVIAMNQFSDVLESATSAVSQALDTQTKGTPVVVFNQLNIPREDLVEADVEFDGKPATAVRVTGPDGNSVASQVSNGKVIFAAKVPSVGYAVYSVEPSPDNTSPVPSDLQVTPTELQNAYYRVTLNQDGDVASIFDKQLNKELLASPARLALSYDNPQQWPAWNMDWTQEQAAPKEYVSGPAKIRIAEKGPVRVALEVTRETAGSRFTQTISLSAGEAGKHVEFGNVIDWATRERNLKATFPLVASNEKATYNWDIGTIDRPTAQPKKFEVPSHQWVDLTDMSGKFGVTLLTDAKNGSDKPDDHTLRLTLIRTPGVAGGYADQATQDIGHHEFKYGFAGHAAGWRDAQTDWDGQRLNAPLLAFAATKHSGSLGKSFSLVKVSNPRIRILGMKKAEESDELVVRLVELDGRPQSDVRVTFAAAVTSAREVNGQEQPVGEARTDGGDLITSFGAYQPRAFALKLAPPPSKVDAVHSEPVTLHYDVATATNDGAASRIGFNEKGDSLPAEMLPHEIAFNDVVFHLAPAATGTPNALIAKGQKLSLPIGSYNRVYVLAASAHGDQPTEFESGGRKTKLNIEDWGGYVGQWDNRQWSSPNTSQGYGEMVGLTPGFIKRADLAWYSSHHHDAAGKNVAYSYSYLFAYSIDVPVGAKTLTLPKNPNVRILAATVANEDTEAKPLQPLYDMLPSSSAGEPDFTFSTNGAMAVSQGHATTGRIIVLPRGSFNGEVRLSAEGLPNGVSFTPVAGTNQHAFTISATDAAAVGDTEFRIIGTSASLHREQTVRLKVSSILKGTVPVDLASTFNVTAIYKRGAKFAENASADAGGYSFSEDTMSGTQVGDEVPFRIGLANAPDAVSSKTVALPDGHYASLRLLATAVEGNQTRQTFTINYTDGTSSIVTQSLSDWSGSAGYRNEADALKVPYRLAADGSVDGNSFYVWAYRFKADPEKELKSISLPSNRNVIVFGITLVPASK